MKKRSTSFACVDQVPRAFIYVLTKCMDLQASQPLLREALHKIQTYILRQFAMILLEHLEAHRFLYKQTGQNIFNSAMSQLQGRYMNTSLQDHLPAGQLNGVYECMQSSLFSPLIPTYYKDAGRHGLLNEYTSNCPMSIRQCSMTFSNRYQLFASHDSSVLQKENLRQVLDYLAGAVWLPDGRIDRYTEKSSLISC